MDPAQHDTGEAAIRPSASLRVAFPAFSALLVFLVLLSPGRVPEATATVLILLGVAAVGLVLDQAALRSARLRPWLRTLGAGLLLLWLYGNLHRVIGWVSPEDWEWRLIALDRAWFGYTWEGWWSGLQSAWFTDVLQIVYALFYFFPFLYAVALARKRDWDGLYDGIDRVLIGFLISYCGYLVVPARSPYEFLEYEAALPSSGLQAWMHDSILGATTTRRDCFPSGHTWLSAYIAWLAWQRTREVFWVLGPWAVLTAIATLYLRYHYLIDVIAGLIACGAWILVTDWIFGRYRPRSSTA